MTCSKICPILLELIKEDNSEVKLCVVEGLHVIAEIVGLENISNILQQMFGMSKEG